MSTKGSLMVDAATTFSSAHPGTTGFSPRRLFADLKIGAKIISLVALAGILTAVVGVVGQKALTDLRKTNQEIAKVTTQKTITALDAKYHYESYRRLILRAVLASSPVKAANI